MQIRKGLKSDIDGLAALYDELNDYLDRHINYPGWRKGIYPVREDAVQGIDEGSLFVADADGKAAGTFILRQQPEKGYELADWKNNLNYNEIFIIHTFAVHPQFFHLGIGKKMLAFILEYAARMNKKAVRLDVYEKNIPAIRLYEKLGFQYIDTVDLGYSIYGLDRFRLYQRLL